MISGGAIITINSVVESQSVTAQPERSITRGEYAEQAPRSGGKFVIVDTTALNDGKVSMDLTCSFPIQNKLITADSGNTTRLATCTRFRVTPHGTTDFSPGSTVIWPMSTKSPPPLCLHSLGSLTWRPRPTTI